MNYNFEDLLKKINYLSENDQTIVKKAFIFAYNAHHNQYRESGETYINHPINVACILADMYVDVNTLVASILHDVVTLSDVTLEDIRLEFGESVETLVSGVTKLSKMEYESEEDNKNANLRKIIMSFRDDVRIILIKLADRLHNMRTLQYKNSRQRRKKALETMDIYVPLAYFIGAYNFKLELEDLSFKYLMPSIYNETVELREQYIKKYSDSINEMINVIGSYLEQENISHKIDVSVKNIYGINKRIFERANKKDIHDLISLKVLVDERIECYLALGIIHSLYKPLTLEFKDFISVPKTNMYRSLHTSVLGPNGKVIQSQIRTKEMDIIDTYGIASYFQLVKDNTSEKMQEDIKKKFQFYESLTEIDDTYFDNKEFVSQVNQELFGHQIYVYTSSGIQIELPISSTIIDFAYKIDPENAHKIVGAEVNNAGVGIYYELKDSDIISLKYDKEIEYPQEEWINHTHITLAKRKILEKIKKN